MPKFFFSNYVHPRKASFQCTLTKVPLMGRQTVNEMTEASGGKKFPAYTAPQRHTT